MRAKKEHKISPKGGPKYKTANYEAKWDFKVPTIHSWVVKLVCYLKESARSIFLPQLGSRGLQETKKSKK